MRVAVLQLSVLLAPLALPAMAVAGFDLKGLTAGTSQEEFLTQYPKAKCAPRAAPAHDMPAPVACEVAGFTIANAKTTSARFHFYRGKLGAIFIDFEQQDYLHVKRALGEKWGDPDPHESSLFAEHMRTPIGGEVAIWQTGGTRMRLAQGEPFRDPSKLWMTTSLEAEWRKEADRRRNAGRSKDV